jgi:short-subunit dehydrogenase
MRMQGRVVIITGASSGIGAELARQLGARGARVGLTARRAEALDQVARAIRDSGGIAAAAPADAGDRAATAAAIARLAGELGPVNVLVANAGLGLATSGTAFSAETVEQMVRVNLLGAVYAFEAVLPNMLARGDGQLVGISSVAGYRGLPGTAGYCATKAGLSVLLESLRVDLRSRGIAVTTVHPGYIRTPMIEGASHPQPFVMEVGPAARAIIKAIEGRRAEIAFPWQMALLMAVTRRLPDAIYDRVVPHFGASRRWIGRSTGRGGPC